MNRQKASNKVETWLLIIALGLGILAAAAGNPVRTSRQSPDWFEINEIAGQEISTIDILQLAGWLMEKRDNYILFDLRSYEKFSQYHIPTARRIELEKTKAEVPPYGPVIIYTGDGTITTEAWQNLSKIYGKRLHLLLGGLRKWAHKVLFPDLTKKSGMDKKEVLRRKKISLFFGGRPRLPASHQKNQGLIYLREGC